MKAKFKTLLAIILSVFMVVTFFPAQSFAEDDPAETTISMVEGEIKDNPFGQGFTLKNNTNPYVAFLDSDGRLCALKEGETEITCENESGEVSTAKIQVADYTDGSDVVGNLKILARYNDSMQFYDGHVYLLFTSYKDNVTITIDDLYGGYDISDKYYKDIVDISNGSNHTGTNTDQYFSYDKNMKSVTLDRGEIVTLGMYRGFDLSVLQAGLGTFTNSTAYEELSDLGKTFIVQTALSKLFDEEMDYKKSLTEFLIVASQLKQNPTGLLNGMVEGGVCFNRELYNQKLEWDQFENVTYELDITEKQLRRLNGALQGNLNNFNMAKNSCATVAVRAWNAAVGTDEDGNETAYELSATGSGIYAIFDAPKTVRDCIVKKLPGYHLNNSEVVGNPEEGFEDETGWVYVSAPKKVDKEQPDPATLKYLRTSVENNDDANATTEFYYYDDESEKITIDESAQIMPNTKVFIKAQLAPTDADCSLMDITLNGDSIFNFYDPAEEAYYAIMPAKNSKLRVVYQQLYLSVASKTPIQLVKNAEINVYDHVRSWNGDKQTNKGMLKWEIVDDSGVLEYTDDSHTSVIAKKAGTSYLVAYSAGNKNICTYVSVEVLDNLDDYVTITYNIDGDIFDSAYIMYDEDDNIKNVPYSGYKIKKGDKVEINVYPYSGNVLSDLKCNNEKVLPDTEITADQNLDFSISFLSAAVEGMPKKICLDSKGDTYQLSPTVAYTDKNHKDDPVFDPTITYESSDSLVAVDENGLITVAEDVPEEGKAVFVTAYAGNSDSVMAVTKVIVGNYQGEKIVGRLTVSSRRITTKEHVPHTAITFTPYDDMDLDVSYYSYYKPTEAYTELMYDYEDNPNKYPSDPAMYSENIPIEDRESYFETDCKGSNSDAETISLRTGESLTLSCYSLDATTQEVILGALGGSTASSEEFAAIVNEVINALAEGDVLSANGPLIFDNAVNLLKNAYIYSFITGHNPIDGDSQGGRTVDREIFNQFRRNDSQLPNNYYTVEITAEELASMEAYISDPDKNYYALFENNCATDVKNIWNAALIDRPELHLKGNYTRFTEEAMSMYAEIGLLRFKVGLDGEGGTNFAPRTVPARHKWEITAEDNKLTAECANAKAEHYYGECEENASLTMEASSCNYADVKLEGLEEFNELTGLDVKATDEFIKFYKTDEEDEVSGGTEVAAGTSDGGFYYAELTINGVSAKYSFKIDSPVTPTVAPTAAPTAAPTNAPTVTPTATPTPTVTPAASSDELLAKKTADLNIGCKIEVTKKKVLKLKWGKVQDAEGYEIYAKAGSGNISYKKPVADIKSGNTTSKNLKKLSGKKISNSKQYCFVVKAYKLTNGKKEYIATSEVYSASAPSRKKYTNVKKVVLKKNNFTIATGGTANIAVKSLKKQNTKKTLSTNAKTMYYFSDNPEVATVSSYGTITGVGKGSCKIYCIAANGTKKTAKVAVN